MRSNAVGNEDSDKPLRDKIEALRKRNEELEGENRKLYEEKKNLEKEIGKLRRELQLLRGSPQVLAASDRTAKAGGVPSSKVFNRRRSIFYRRPNHNGKPNGGQPGHKGVSRRNPEPNAPPVRITLDKCPDCGTTVTGTPDVTSRTIFDIPLHELLIYLLETERYKCKGCNKKMRADPPIPPYKHYGPNLMGWIATLRMLGTSLRKIQLLLRITYGLHVSLGTIWGIEKHVAKLLGPSYEALKREVRKANIVGPDESGFRVGGEPGWLWAFTWVMSVLYVVAPTRGSKVPLEVLGEDFKALLVRDGWKPYDKLSKAKQQLDWVHIGRWLERAEVLNGVEPRPLLKPASVKLLRPGRPPEELIRFADGLRELVREAVPFHEAEPAPSAKAREAMYERLMARLDEHLSQPWKHADAVRIAKELRTRREQVFTFIRIPEAPWHNNDAERMIRAGVLHRKISAGRNTWEGAGVFQVLLSVFETCKRRGESFYDLVRSLAAAEASAHPQKHRGFPQT